MLVGHARIARVVRHQHAIDVRQRVRLRPARLAGGKAPQLVARRRVLFIAESAFLHVLRLFFAVEIGAVKRAAVIHHVGEIPAQHHVVDAVAMLRVALFDDFQPEQHAADIDGGETDLAGFVQVVHFLAGNSVVGLVGHLVLEQHQFVQRRHKLQQTPVEFRFIDNAKLARRRQRRQIGGAVPHGGGGIFVNGVYQSGRGLRIGHKIGPGVSRYRHFALVQLAVTHLVIGSGQADRRLNRRRQKHQRSQQGSKAGPAKP